MNVGDMVKMTEECKRDFLANDSVEHVDEFGSCLGKVLGHATGPSGETWPELRVRWQPSGLVYSYMPSSLEVVR